VFLYARLHDPLISFLHVAIILAWILSRCFGNSSDLEMFLTYVVVSVSLVWQCCDGDCLFVIGFGEFVDVACAVNVKACGVRFNGCE
jgi:hypothetical protein